MAVVNRTSKQVVQFLGADITARNTGGGLHNVVKDGLGGERFQQPDTQRGTSVDFEDGALNINEYQAALVHMENNGVQPLAAKSMALVLLDVAKVRGLNVMSLINNTEAQELALVGTEAYQYINQLRNGNSQLSGSNTIDNSKSLRSRYLVA